MEDKKLHKKDNTAEDRPKISVKVSRLDLIEHSKLKDIYPMLDEYGHYLAVHAHMTPYEACYLALYSKEILKEACMRVVSYYGPTKAKVRNSIGLIKSTVKKIAEEQSYTVNETFLNTIRYFTHVDSSWTKLTWCEESLLTRKVRYMTDMFEAQRIKKEQEQEATRVKQASQQQTVIRRDNPYSVNFTGILDPRESLRRTREQIAKHKTSYSGTPQNIAAVPPEAPAAQRHEGRIEADNIFARILNGENI